MTYNWALEEEGQAQTERMPLGVHNVMIVKIIRGKGGQTFTSASGDPKIMLVYEDSQGRQAATMYTLSEKAVWALKIVLSRSGTNLDELTEQGIELHHFADQSFAESKLLGKKLVVDITYKKGNDGKDYPNIVPIKQEDEHPVEKAGAGAKFMDDADIPF